MKNFSEDYLRIAFFIARPTKLAREWFRGTMLYTRHNPKWFVRVFELGDGITEALLEFGTIRPDGIIACGVPARFLQNFFRERDMSDVPIIVCGMKGINERASTQDPKGSGRLVALATSRQSITDITYASGFGSLSRLKAIFQKTHGMSMRKYRKLHQLDDSPCAK